MRSILVLPLVAAFALGACSDGGADADGDGKITDEEAAAEAAEAGVPITGPRPGQYRVKSEFTETNVPGMSVEMMNQFAKGADLTYCITEQDPAKAAREMAGRSSESSCEFKTFDVSGGRLTTEMVCAGADGQATTIKSNGTISADRMEVDAEVVSAGMTQKMHVVHERIGDCTG